MKFLYSINYILRTLIPFFITCKRTTCNSPDWHINGKKKKIAITFCSMNHIHFKSTYKRKIIWTINSKPKFIFFITYIFTYLKPIYTGKLVGPISVWEKRVLGQSITHLRRIWQEMYHFFITVWSVVQK